MTTHIPRERHATVLAPVVQNGVGSVPGFGRIVAASPAVATATTWALLWGTMDARPIIAAVHLVWADGLRHSNIRPPTALARDRRRLRHPVFELSNFTRCDCPRHHQRPDRVVAGGRLCRSPAAGCRRHRKGHHLRASPGRIPCLSSKWRSRTGLSEEGSRFCKPSRGGSRLRRLKQASRTPVSGLLGLPEGACRPVCPARVAGHRHLHIDLRLHKPRARRSQMRTRRGFTVRFSAWTP